MRHSGSSSSTAHARRRAALGCLLLLALPLLLHAQQGEADSTILRAFRLRDGTLLTGRLLAADSAMLRIRTEEGRSVRVARSALDERDEQYAPPRSAIDSAAVYRDDFAEAWAETAAEQDPTGLLLIPTGRVLRAGECTVGVFAPFPGSGDADFGTLLIPAIGVGIADIVQVGVGGTRWGNRSTDPYIIGLSGKFSVYRNPHWDLALGLVLLTSTEPDYREDPSLRCFQALATYHDRVASLTFGAQMLSTAPVLYTAGADLTLHRNLHLIADLQFLESNSYREEMYAVGSAALRLRFGGAAIDAGLMHFTEDFFDMGDATWLPCLQVSFTFGP
jgi:hypothetical protein